VLLQRYGNQGAVVFGSVTSGRPASLAGVESILGLFINTVPVVVESGAEETVLGLLQAQHEQQVAREGHSYCPLYEIQKQSPLGEPLFNSVFVFENYPVDAQLSEADEQSGLEVTTAETTEGTNYDLTVVAHVSEGLSIRLEGGAGHYNSASLARLGGHYKRLLLGLTKALKVAEVELLSERERSYLLTELNSTAQDVEVPSCLLHELFERQAKSQPDAVAVETASESISYGQLNQRANQLARQLQHQAVQLGDAVGILLTRSVNMVVAVLAVLKAGGR
ncbi:condensation domain-containing protein, partial [Pseudoalteromonas maricaloris]